LPESKQKEKEIEDQKKEGKEHKLGLLVQGKKGLMDVSVR